MISRNKYVILAFLFTCFFILPKNSFAEEILGSYDNVNTSKTWKIHFSANVDEESAERAISIKYGNYTYYPEISIDGKTIYVYPPDNGYEQDQIYILQINENLKSTDGEKLSTGYSLIFLTDSKEQTPQIEEQLNYPSTNGQFTKEFTARSNELRTLWQHLQPVYEGPLADVEPSITPPYHPGTLRSEALLDALNVTNFIREIASLPSVSLNDTFNERAQAASLVNAVNQKLTHYPAQPTGMDEGLFNLGYKGASSSNLGFGYGDIIQSIQYGYMEDGDSSNIHAVGHRLWILSPKLQKVGFGYVSPMNGRPMTAMHVIDDEMYYNPSVDYDFISWPAETAMPTAFFTSEFPWSISLNPEKYNYEKIDDIKVTLTRINDNKTWNFDSDQADGFFTISLSNYGYLPFTIIFRPYDKPVYNENDVYHVKVEGIYDWDGNKESIEFQTQFFDL